MSSWNSDDSARYWTQMLAKSGALVINGDLYFVGAEPTSAELAANPKAYGCYGAGFTIGLDDGTQIVTHNLGCCGAVPTAVCPPDNAAFIGEPTTTPLPRVATHDCFDHLDYIGGPGPYECLFCYQRFHASEIPAAARDSALAYLTGGE
jgi:hypothetical protein